MENGIARAKTEDLEKRVFKLEEEVGLLRERVAEMYGQVRGLVALVGIVSATASLLVQVIGLIIRR